MSSDVTPDGLPVLAAVVARQSEDLSVYAAFLLEALAGPVPAEALQVERQRGRFGRTSPDAPVHQVRVRLGENTYGLSRAGIGGAPVATVAHTVGGIVLRTEHLPLDVWCNALAMALETVARSNERAAAALARLAGFTL